MRLTTSFEYKRFSHLPELTNMVCNTREPYDPETLAWIAEADTPREKERRKQRAKYLRHKERYKALARERYVDDPEKILACNAKWREKHPEKVAADKLAWEKKFKEEHPEEYRARRKAIEDRRKPKKAAAGRAWRKANPDKNCAKAAKYRAAKLHRTVPWANDFFIEEAYALARLRTEMTGFEWSVDHICPMQGEFISGLHVENNLQVIPAVDNLSKSNKWHA